MVRRLTLRSRIRTKLMIAIPLLTAVLVFGSTLFAYYVTKGYLVGLVDDSDVLLFNRVVDILGKQLWVATIASALIGWLLAYAITLPIRRLTESAQGIATGDLTRSVRVDTEDEIGMLGQTFNVMVTSLNEHIMESMRGGVITINMSGVIVTFNKLAEMMLGYAPEEVIGKPVREIFSAQDDQLALIVETVLSQQHIAEMQEIAIRAKDGNRITIRLSTALLRDKKNMLVGLLVTFKDIERVKHIEEQIRRTDRLAAVGTLATGVAHEIRNPLGSIKGLVRLMQESAQQTDKYPAYFEIIVKEVDRLNGVVEDLLAFARPDPVKAAEQLVPVDVHAVIEQTLQLAIPDAAHSRIIINRDFAGDIPLVTANEKKLQQAFLNIVLNAIAVMRDTGGVITVSTRTGPEPHQCSIIIHDTGPGIAPEELAKIFDPFYTTKQFGTGLGLTITHHIVMEMGGSIDVNSPEGAGTSFCVRLPVVGR